MSDKNDTAFSKDKEMLSIRFTPNAKKCLVALSSLCGMSQGEILEACFWAQAPVLRQQALGKQAMIAEIEALSEKVNRESVRPTTTRNNP